MTIKKLKEIIKDLPDNLEVFIKKENDDFDYALVEEVEIRNVKFSDDELIAYENVLVITDEL